jgi:serine protease Do
MPLPNFGEVFEELRRSTVVVYGRRGGTGSGVICSSDGLIVTNAHVARASRLSVQLSDGREFEARAVARDLRRDLASLEIPARGLAAAALRDSPRLRPGELAIAVGNPLGFIGALTTGVVQAIGPIPSSRIPGEWVQSDVRLAPGSSGGPLADAQGRVIGINTMVRGPLALAIPSGTVKEFLLGRSDGWLGITVCPVELPQGIARRFGLLLVEVQPGSPAAQASLLVGDILLGTDKKPFEVAGDLRSEIEGRTPRLLRLQFLRGGDQRVRRVTVQLDGARGSVAA